MAQDIPTLTEGTAAPLLPDSYPPSFQITSAAIAPVAQLAREAAARVEFLKIPPEALPESRLIGQPHLLTLIDAEGHPIVKSLKTEIDAYRTKPAFREGTATALTLESFVDLVNRHANADTAIFVDADWQAPKLTAVIDYHTQAATPVNGEPPKDRVGGLDGEDPHARPCKHRVHYAFPLSEPWKVWVASNGKYMAQGDFAEFLEDHIHELASPNGSVEEQEMEDRFKTRIADPSTIMDLARGLDVKVGATVKNRQRLQTGETNFVFETVHTDNEGRELTVPGLFMLGVPIFYRGAVQRLAVRLRYRVQGGSILWAYQIHRPDEAVDATVRKDVEQVDFDTRLPVYDGAPEAL